MSLFLPVWLYYITIMRCRVCVCVAGSNSRREDKKLYISAVVWRRVCGVLYADISSHKRSSSSSLVRLSRLVVFSQVAAHRFDISGCQFLIVLSGHEEYEASFRCIDDVENNGEKEEARAKPSFVLTAISLSFLTEYRSPQRCCRRAADLISRCNVTVALSVDKPTYSAEENLHTPSNDLRQRSRARRNWIPFHWVVSDVHLQSVSRRLSSITANLLSATSHKTWDGDDPISNLEMVGHTFHVRCLARFEFESFVWTSFWKEELQRR